MRPDSLSRAPWLLAVALAVMLASCSDGYDPSTPCTQAGCLNGVVVRVLGPLPEGTLVVLTPSDPLVAARSFGCGGDASCFRHVDDFTPETFTVTVTGPGIDHEETVTPTYETLQPNGPDCPPTCRAAEVVIDPG